MKSVRKGGLALEGEAGAEGAAAGSGVGGSFAQPLTPPTKTNAEPVNKSRRRMLFAASFSVELFLVFIACPLFLVDSS
jgi:hypothetical protein